MDRDAAGTYETQFVSQSDDDGNLYNVEKILDERGRKYLVQWEGTDPQTGKKWKPDWVLKTDCTDDLIADWKKEKEGRKRLAATSKRSSSASGSVSSRPTTTKTTSTFKRPKSKSTHASTSPPASEARSNSSVNTGNSKLVKQKSRFVIQLPARAGTKRPREPEATTSPISPVKRLRLDGPASPLPASPFDNDDGGIVRKKQVGPVTYKKRKPVVGKSPLSKKSLGPLVGKVSKISARNEASSSRAKPLHITSPKGGSKKGIATNRTPQSDQDDTATEDEDSDPQLPERRKSNPSKSSDTTGPLTRSRQPLKPPSKQDASVTSFVRPHPTTCARTRPLPARDPATNRATLRALLQGAHDSIPERVRKSVGARNKFPKVVTGSREKPPLKKGNLSGGAEETGDLEEEAIVNGENDIEVEEQPKQRSSTKSGLGSSPPKSVSRRGGGTGGKRGNSQGEEGERVMSSVESENGLLLSQQEPFDPLLLNNTGITPGLPKAQPQFQSQGNSSKGTVVPNSQVPPKPNNLTQESLPTEPLAPISPSPSPPRSPLALAKSNSSISRGKQKLRPSEAFKLGKGIVVKPRVSVARTESTLIETVPTELAQPASGSEYDPLHSKPPSQSSSSSSPGSSNSQPVPTPSSSGEESQSETDEVDSNEDDDEAELAKDGPSSRTRSQSLSQIKSKTQPLWGDGTPAKVKPLDLTGQVSALLPRDEEEEDEDEQGPVPTSSPSLGGGRTGSPGPVSPESPSRRRKVVEVVLPSPTRSSQQTASQTSKLASQPQEEPDARTEAVTQDTVLELEIDSLPAWPNDSHDGRGDEQVDSLPNDPDQSLAHAMEIDELLAGDMSHQLEEELLDPVAQGDTEAPEASVIDLSNTTMDASQSVLVLDPDQSLADRSMELAEPTEPLPSIPSQPESQLPTSSSSLPQPPKANTMIPPTYLPSLPSDSSHSQQPPDTQPSALDPQDIQSQPPPESQLEQPPSQLVSQLAVQDNTHSSIEELSSWSFPPAGQAPRPADTISSFTPTNPSTRAPRTSEEHPPASSNPFPLSSDGNAYGPEVPRAQSSVGFEPHNSTLGPVPDLGTEIFQRGRSPGSDIDQFDSPPKATPTFLQDGSTTSPELKRNQSGVLGLDFGAAAPGHVNSSTQSEREREMVEALKEAEIKLAARDHRIVELTAQLEELAAEKSRVAAVHRDDMAQSGSIRQQREESHAAEVAEYRKTITDLQLQLAAVQSQYEIVEAQRAASYEQYTLASNETKPLADENRALKDRVQVLEKQVTAGLQQWQRGFELNIEKKQHELERLQAQLDLEREIRVRTEGREVCRRAAEWYELKKRVEDLEVENLDVERQANAARKREQDLRLRERELEERIKTLETLATQPSQSQPDQGLSQDDMQTETLLSDRSAVLADLDGPTGDDMVWMCTYRDSSDKLCGQAFDTMGLLMAHVLDADGHKVDAGCQCG